MLFYCLNCGFAFVSWRHSTFILLSFFRKCFFLVLFYLFFLFGFFFKIRFHFPPSHSEGDAKEFHNKLPVGRDPDVLVYFRSETPAGQTGTRVLLG